jgi:chromate transporter
VSAGLIAAMALRLLQARGPDRLGWILLAATFVMVGLLRWPLVAVMLSLGSLSVLLAWRRGRPR